MNKDQNAHTFIVFYAAFFHGFVRPQTTPMNRIGKPFTCDATNTQEKLLKESFDG